MNFTNLKNFMDHLTNWIIPGNSISVYYRNEEVFRYSSGYSDLEMKKPMSEDLYLNIYSCSKVATVVAALQLLEQGKLLLSDPLYDYIPAYREMQVKGADGNLMPAKNVISIGNLFTMTAGLTYNRQSDGIKRVAERTDGKMNTVQLAEGIADDPLAFEPGTAWGYSLCHDVLAAVVEVITGKRFAEYVKENIFVPCGIQKAAYHHTPEILENMATQYRYSVSGAFDPVAAQRGETKEMVGTLERMDHTNMTLGPMHDSGGAGVITTVSEYVKLANALARGGKSHLGEQILSPGTIELLRTNQLTKEQSQFFNWPQLQGYGYGLGVRTLVDKAKSGSIGSLGEFGWGGAAGATLLADPDREFAFFYAHHMLNPQEEYYQPRLRNAAYSCLDR